MLQRLQRTIGVAGHSHGVQSDEPNLQRLACLAVNLEEPYIGAHTLLTELVKLASPSELVFDVAGHVIPGAQAVCLDTLLALHSAIRVLFVHI